MREEDEVPHPQAVERKKESFKRNLAGIVGIGMSIAAFANGMMNDNDLMQIAGFVGVMFSGERITWAELGLIVPWRTKSEE